jgi:phenylalanyl-tRNA synthetase alpha chain
MIDKIIKIKNETIKKLEELSDIDVWRELELKIMGRKGELTMILRNIQALSDADKKTIGQAANEIKKELEDRFQEVRTKILGNGKAKSNFIDVTLPGQKFNSGHLHPITILQNEIEDFFTSLGFMSLDGPELESDYYCFEALNIPKTHPARDMQDTFYIDQKNKDGEYDMVMRTHTSPMQVRAMEKYGAPIKCIVPGRCFRSESTDIRHEHTFYQVEGLMLDKDISISNMKALLEETAKFLFGQNTKFRMRPKFYPFVEPGMNGEVTCHMCNGAGCRLCKHSGWLEIVGAGMVHPNVIRAGGIDPEIYSGFAFGFGLNRLAQLKYGIEDVRLFNSGDLRFLEQF